VSRYAETGYAQIKIYASIPPPWVPAIAAAAHARGLRVSGHVPNGMNAADAVLQGFDEIQHVNYLFLRFLAGPGDDTRTLLRVTRVAERGRELGLDGPDVERFLDLLAAHRTVLDPTLVIFRRPVHLGPGRAGAAPRSLCGPPAGAGSCGCARASAWRRPGASAPGSAPRSPRSST